MGFHEDDRIRAKNAKWDKYVEDKLIDLVKSQLMKCDESKPEMEKEDAEAADDSNDDST